MPIHDLPAAERLLDEIRQRIRTHATPEMTTAIEGLLLSSVATPSVVPDYSMTQPLLVVMAQGGKSLLLGDQVREYRAGQCLVITADLPITGHYIDIEPGAPALGMGLVLRPAAVAGLILRARDARRPRPSHAEVGTAIGTADAGPELLDAVARLLRLLDHPSDAAVLAPLLEQEILWRLLTGPLGGILRQIGLADSNLAHVNSAIGWIRDHYAEPLRIDDLARLAGMSTSALHRRFRDVTAMSPLQFQKRIRLQHARTLLMTHPGDIAGIGHTVGYDSPSQFNREYRRLFGNPPGQDGLLMRGRAEAPGLAALA